MPVDKPLACVCHLSKQHKRMRFRSLTMLVERRFCLLSPLGHCPPLRIPDFLSVSAALRECARNDVEVFECSDDVWWRHDAIVAAVPLRVRHRHALDRFARGAIAEPILDEVSQPAEESAERTTLARQSKSGLGSSACKMPVGVAHMRA
ncbi:hypothetical protein [Paraburkholderia sp. SIMBA_030]|uniref:hypothetical protein n=1 Tax=Paraburkholderia sp. SIMBA_030 TaxID=3085773 RepID=UPI00397DD21E